VTTPADPSRAHAAAVLTLVEASEYPVYLGKVTVPDADLTYPPLIVWPPPGRRNLIAIAGTAATLTGVIQETAVGRDADEVLAALDRTAAQLVGVTPTITGRRCARITEVGPGAPVVQNDGLRTPDGQPTYRGVALYQLMSTAA